MSWTVKDGDAVIEEGQMGDMFYFVEEGEAIVSKKIKDDSGEVVDKPLSTLKKGD
jgi:cAMP-dependent protein kinase regulator